MIARVKRPKSHRTASARHAEFLAMLPAIRGSAQIAFRKLPPELRHDLIEEVVANSYVAFARLVERGHADRASASPLARYAIAQVRVGRRVGTGCGSATCCQATPSFAKSFPSNDSTSSVMRTAAGGRSLSKTNGPHPPTLPPGGSTLRNGCAG